MKLGAKIAVGIIAAVGLAAITISVIGPLVSDCTTQRMSSVVSPAGDMTAEHYQTLCRSEGVPKTEIHLVHDGTRVSTVIGQAAASHVELSWKDGRSLLVTVPPGLDKAFDRTMQGVNMEFQVVDEARLTPSRAIEPAR